MNYSAILPKIRFCSIVTEMNRRVSPRAPIGFTGSFEEVALRAAMLLRDSGLEMLKDNEPTKLAARPDTWLVENVVALYNGFARANWISRYEDPSNLEAAVKLYLSQISPR